MKNERGYKSQPQIVVNKIETENIVASYEIKWNMQTVLSVGGMANLSVQQTHP